MPTSFVYNDIGFNADSIALYKTEADFIKSHTGQKAEGKDEDGKTVKVDHHSTDLTEDQLKEVYKLAIAAVKAHPQQEEKPVVKITHTDAEGNVVAAKEQAAPADKK